MKLSFFLIRRMLSPNLFPQGSCIIFQEFRTENMGIITPRTRKTNWKTKKRSFISKLIPAAMHPQLGFKVIIIGLFIVISTLYILYSSVLLLNKYGQDCNDSLHLSYSSSLSTSRKLDQEQEDEEEEDSTNPQKPQRYDTELKHIVFGIAASSNLWETRKEYIKVWWRPKETRGVVWVDKQVRTIRNEGLPETRVSGETSQFSYTNIQGQRSALRISRVVSEMFRLGLEDVRWFVMGDDDTVFLVENLVRILSKYDHTQFYYVGSSSESHIQNIFFSYAMAFGGGGFAISYPLAKELQKMQDRCIQRYPGLYGSDDRIQACMAELGVPLTKEIGFHQYDLYGDLLGLLAAHPVTPLVSLHHLDVVEPIFPGMTRPRAMRHLFQSVNTDSASIMQQSICYDNIRSWSISVSWGFVVLVYRGVISPRELERPSRTFLNWYKRADYTAYAFNTRPVAKHPCEEPFVFYMHKVRYHHASNQTVGFYNRHESCHPYCRWKVDSPEKVDTIVVFKRPDPLRWQKSPRRDCCRVLPWKNSTTMYIWVDNCLDDEISELQKQPRK